MRFSSTRIWDQAEYCSFTDLCRHKGRWVCVFREGEPVSRTLGFEVVDAAMPDEPTLTTMHFAYFTWPIAERFCEETARNLRDHYSNARCIPNMYFPYPRPHDAEGNLTGPIDFSGLDRIIDLMPDTRLWVLWPGFEWDYGNFMPNPGDEARERLFTAWVKEVLDHMEERGYGTDEVAFFWVDEPNRKLMEERVLPAARLLKQVRPDALNWMDITGNNTPQSLAAVEPYIDIWCPGETKLDWGFWESKRTWFYTTASSKGQWPGPYYRYQLWQAFDAGCEGHAFWVYTDNAGTWDDYASNSPSYSVVYMGEDGVVDSKRWEAYRAGIEDYELCKMIREAVMSAQTEARELEPQYHRAGEALDMWTRNVLDARDNHMVQERAHTELVGHLQALWELRGR